MKDIPETDDPVGAAAAAAEDLPAPEADPSSGDEAAEKPPAAEEDQPVPEDLALLELQEILVGRERENIERLEDRVAAEEERLIAQYSSLQETLALLSSQQNYLSSFLQSLGY